MTKKKSKVKENPELPDHEDDSSAEETESKPNPTTIKGKKILPTGDKIFASVVGFASGVGIHHFMGLLRPEIESKLTHKVPVPHGKTIGPIVTFLGLVLPESELRYFVTGAGMGVTVDDVLFHTFKQYAFPKITLNETSGEAAEIDLIKRYSHMLHVDESLSVPDKEAIILPEFPGAVHGQRNNPLQVNAIKTILKECKIAEDKGPTLTDLYWIQQWILYWGIYEGNEGLWPGHDRIRTAAKLVRVRDNGDWTKDGHAAFRYDCDCGATVTNQIMDFFGFPTKYALISQKTELADGVHPLHHIFPIVKAKGRLWMIETIKEAPIIPLEFCYEIFDGLQRVVIVNDDGSFYDYAAWRPYRLKALTMGKKKRKIVEEA